MPHQSSRTSKGFLRYPGGKGRMLDFLGSHLSPRSQLAERYVEPFVGGGAVFFFLSPQRALLSDSNTDLIDLYRGIRQAPSAVWQLYSEFGDSKTAYHRVRASERPKLLVERAARTLFLNRTCFKGMWRHNLDGQFNVGYGGQARRWAISEITLVAAARALRKARFQCQDFETAIDDCEAGDFLFLDPPYRPGEREQTNDHYVARQFTFEDHRRLAAALTRAQKRGAAWSLTTSAHMDIIRLFRGRSALAIPRGTGRMPGISVVNSGELLIASYPLDGGHRL